MIAFRARPEDPGAALPASTRRDEIGLVQTELARMQEGLRAALAQKTRLAALGAAVGKINHDLRNLLANAMLLSDRLEQSQDPEVRHVAPRLVESMDRAARLCAETLNFARAEVVRPQKTRFALAPLLDEVGESLLGPDQTSIRWRNEVRAEVMLHADRDQLFRVLVNLGRNAAEALGEAGGLISIGAWQAGDATVIELADTGKGIAEAARNSSVRGLLGLDPARRHRARAADRARDHARPWRRHRAGPQRSRRHRVSLDRAQPLTLF